MIQTLQDANDFTTISDFLAVRDITELNREKLKEEYGFSQVDMLILFGGSIPFGCRMAAEAILHGIGKQVMIVGGIGHTTNHLRRCISEKYPFIDVHNRPEADIITDYFETVFGIKKSRLIIENHSANCGENIIFGKEILQKMNLAPDNILMMQDSSMQKRMDATFKKSWDLPYKNIINFAAYRPKIVYENGELAFQDNSLWGLWSIERYIELLMGEMIRLIDDVDGYGPKGKNYIIHVDIPEEVMQSYHRLKKNYSTFIRKVWKQ